MGCVSQNCTRDAFKLLELDPCSPSKIEGDESNSRYWYAQTDHEYDEYQDPFDELRAIQSELT